MRILRRIPVLVLLLFWLALPASGQLRTQAASAPAKVAMTSVVNSLADDVDAYAYDDPNTEDVDESMDGKCEDAQGRCTLRAALDEAWNLDVPAEVTFSPSLSGLLVINPAKGGFGPPPGSTIRGYEQSVTITGSGPYAVLMGIDSNTTIQGLSFYDGLEGIDVGGKHNTIGGATADLRNIFTHMSQAAINLLSDDNTVQGNFIGINGLNNVEGNQFGIFVSNSSNNLIGGTGPGEGNVISGNNQGIALVGDSTESGLTFSQNKIYGNFIGTDSSGTLARPNQYGITAQFQHGLIIGDNGLSQGNVISGNSVAGIALGANADTTKIVGNWIGTDYTGVYGIPNRTGVILGPGSMNSILEHNIISSNQWEGVLITGYDLGNLPSVHHRVSGNQIVLNGNTGIVLMYTATDNIIGSSLTQTFLPNTIQYNGQGSGAASAGGVVIDGYVGIGIPRANTIRKNDFMDNAPGGIRFGQAAGLQDGIQPPVIQAYTTFEDGAALIEGTHHRPGSLIDIYTAGYVSGPTYQGRQWLGSTTVDGSGQFAIAMDSCTCSRIIAIATDAAGNSSAFSQSFPTRTAMVSADLQLNSGWNMVSVPATVSNFQTSALFPGSTVGAYSYSGGYNPAPTLATGLGYWVRYPAPATVTIQGTAVEAETVAVAAGWNLIGSVTNPVAAASIATQPGGLATSQFFRYNLAYEIADTIVPGQAYWVKCSGAGSLMLSSAANVPAADRIRITHGDELPPPAPGEGPASAAATLPAHYLLEQNFPNPFNPATEIRYQLPEGGNVVLSIFDVLGREVARLVDRYEEAGYHAVTWNGEGAGTGVYVCRLSSGSFTATRHMVLLR